MCFQRESTGATPIDLRWPQSQHARSIGIGAPRELSHLTGFTTLTCIPRLARQAPLPCLPAHPRDAPQHNDERDAREEGDPSALLAVAMIFYRWSQERRRLKDSFRVKASPKPRSRAEAILSVRRRAR